MFTPASKNFSTSDLIDELAYGILTIPLDTSITSQYMRQKYIV
jgi:hypothetical protein